MALWPTCSYVEPHHRGADPQSVLAITFALYILFTDSGTQFNPGSFLEQTSPHAWAMTGIALNIGLSVVGAGWYVPSSSPPQQSR